MTYEEIKKNEEVLAYLKKGNDVLGVMGYTDHSVIHCSLVAERAAYILKNLGYSAKEAELAKIAGFMHDIGNLSLPIKQMCAEAVSVRKIRRPSTNMTG